MKGILTGLSQLDHWEKLFKENEEAHAEGGQPLTDEELAQAMLEEFPNAKGSKSSLTRVSMYRSNYNTASHMFDGREQPKVESKTRPWSFRYLEDGTRVMPTRGRAIPEKMPSDAVDIRKGSAPKPDGAKKPTSKKKSTRKKRTRSKATA